MNPGTQEPSCFIKRVQLFANGQRCDDISEYGRCCFLYSLLKPADWYKNKGITGFWELAGLVPAPIPAQNYTRTSSWRPRSSACFKPGSSCLPS